MSFDRRAALKRAMKHFNAGQSVEKLMLGKYAGAFLQIGCSMYYEMATVRCMYLKGQISKEQMVLALARIQYGKVL